MRKLGFILGLMLTAMSTAVFAQTKMEQVSTEVAAKVVTVQQPGVRLMNTHANAAEAYMELDNKGQKAHTLIAAYTPVDEETVLHKTVMENGKPVMRKIQRIVIPAKNATELKFGGIHVMLLGIKEPLMPNQVVNITLIFNDGSNLVVPAKVSA